MSTAEPQPLVLYVDDEAPNRVVFERGFGKRFRVESVSSGADALERVAKEQPAVVLADQRMAGMTGTELLSILRERIPDTVRVIVTAYADPEPMLQAINQSGASRYIVKPWNAAEVNAVLQGAIENFQLTRALRKLQTELLEAQRFGSLGVIAASVAHDMASPISALMSNMERLGTHSQALNTFFPRAERAGVSLSAADRDVASELGDIVRESSESAEYLGTLVQGMRGHARADTDARADPKAVLAFVSPLVRGAVQERGAKLEVQADAALPSVRLAQAELCQVLVNLVTNAAQALSRELPERRVTLSAVREGQGVLFRVADTGQGMTPEQVARAGRERFTTKPVGQGTGLGLTIVRELVEGRGGRFDVVSALGEGTTVSLWLPIAE